MLQIRTSVKFPLYLKRAGLASRNIVHLQKIIRRCVSLRAGSLDRQGREAGVKNGARKSEPARELLIFESVPRSLTNAAIRLVKNDS